MAREKKTRILVTENTVEIHFKSVNNLDCKYNWLLEHPGSKIFSGHIFKSVKSWEFGMILKYIIIS